jgi:predicted membrane channel-forming protein YqfA (hemolysin III family)
VWRCTVRLDWWQRARARAGQHAWSGPAEFAANPLAAGTDFCCARPGPSAASFVWIVMLFFCGSPLTQFICSTTTHRAIDTHSSTHSHVQCLSHSQQPVC